MIRAILCISAKLEVSNKIPYYLFLVKFSSIKQLLLMHITLQIKSLFSESTPVKSLNEIYRIVNVSCTE
jgi:hypothetical protein